MLKQAHLTISGRVQGVFFRDFAQENAQILGIKGWVRNASDGTVEAVVQGEEDEIQELIKRLNQGPSSANVTDVKVDWQPMGPQLTGFEIRY